MGRLKALEQSCLSAVDVTQERLLTLLKENAETEFGKKHEFSEICSVYDYKRKVPFSVFDDYAASVDRMKNPPGMCPPISSMMDNVSS